MCQSTRRQQSRGSVSQAADRIRRAIARNPEERLTALLQHITVEALRRAYLGLKKDAAPGIDGIRWEEYGAKLEERNVVTRPLRRCSPNRTDASSPRGLYTTFFNGIPPAAERFFLVRDQRVSEYLMVQRVESFVIVPDEKRVPSLGGRENLQDEFCVVDQSILRRFSGKPFAVVQDDSHALSPLVHDGHTIGVQSRTSGRNRTLGQ